MIPQWFTTLSIVMLLIGGLWALVIVVDLLRGHRQQMGIMNVVWPVTALFGTVLTLWLYFKYGCLATRENFQKAKQVGEDPPSMRLTPFPAMVAKGASHCGSGCTLGDIIAEFLALAFPAVAVWFGWKTLLPDSEMGKTFAVWVLDFLFAFAIGMAFQYFTIKPMRDLSPGRGLMEAVKADTLSLTSWQVGMYGGMAIAQFAILMPLWHTIANPSGPEFWFLMQLAMLCGFATSYPVNWWLIRSGIKEKM